MRITKQVVEKIPLEYDFADLLPTGETLQPSSAVTVTDPDGVDVTGAMVAAQSITTTGLSAIIQAGEALKDYKVFFTAVTQNYTFKENLTLLVRNY